MRGQLLVCDLPSFTYILQLSYSFESRSAVVVSWKIVYIYIYQVPSWNSILIIPLQMYIQIYTQYIYTLSHLTIPWYTSANASILLIIFSTSVGFLFRNPSIITLWLCQNSYWKWPSRNRAVCQNLVPLVNIKIAGKWMFIPLKMVLIGIDPYP